MSLLALDQPTCITCRHPLPANDILIRKQVSRIFQLHHQCPVHTDRRGDRREPFPYPIPITPLNRNGLPENDETIFVLGKHLSERGLDFYYKAPVPYRRVITSWECRDDRWLGLLLDLRWCRSNGHGWYENGGRFLQVVDSPFDPCAELTSVEQLDSLAEQLR